MKRFFRSSSIISLVVALVVIPSSVFAYGQAGYYGQGTYYAQSYYEGSYTGACGSYRTVMASPSSHFSWAGTFVRDALIALVGLERVDAYSESAYYGQGSYYFQTYYQGTYGPAGVCITKYPWSVGAGGYAPASNTYWGGGGGGGLVINNASVSGGSGYGSSGNGGSGYGGGGGGSYLTNYGGSGAPGVVYVEWDDAAPTAPTVSGPTTLQSGETGTFSYQSTDPEIDTIRYGIDWDANGTVDQWNPASATASSGQTLSSTHSWSGAFSAKTFKVMAEDSAGVDSGWTTYTVNVTSPTPTALLTASPSSITNGQSSTLTWSSSYADYCTGTNFSTVGATSGTVTVSPTVSTTYTVTCTGTSGSAASSKTVAYTCTPQNICSGTNVVNSCTSAVIQSCSYSCSAGACVTPPPPEFNGFTSTSGTSMTGHFTARPSLIRAGTSVTLWWNISSVTNCTISGNSQSWSGASAGCSGNTCYSGASGIATLPVMNQTTFTMMCSALDGSTVNESQTVNVAPIFQEQ